jgi:hypothetical protein
MEDPDDDLAGRCPYCASEDDCEHLLLLVGDRQAVGGALFELFGAKWSAIEKEFGEAPDFDEGAEFCKLLEIVHGLADASWDYDFDGGGPGMSASYSVFYVSSKARLVTARKAFGQLK